MIIDFNAYVGNWPEHDIDIDGAGLLAMMDSAGIDSAVTSDLQTTFCDKDAEDSIAKLSDSRIVRFPIVTPDYSLERCKSERAKGMRLYPTYHEWDFNSSHFSDLLSCAQQERWIVQICVRLRDPRLMPQIRESAEVLSSLQSVIEGHPGVKFVLTGATFVEILAGKELFTSRNVWLETSHLQYPMNCLPKTVDLIGGDHILFGSNAPFFYMRSGVYRVEHTPISDDDKEKMLWRNAESLLL